MNLLIDIIDTTNEPNIIEGIMKDQFLELQILSSEIWSEAKAIRHNACNKKRAISKIEKLVEKLKKIDFETEIELIKQVNNITN
jgi:hypothetical protein